MAVRMLREQGDPVLRQKAREVKGVDHVLTRLIEDMFETMYHYNGIGLAAPQIGISKRIIAIEVGQDKVALVNPVVVHQEGEEIDIEGCLSVPGIYGEVSRARSIRVKGLNADGVEQEVQAEGLLARALQHELDHLDGILFVDKVIRFIPKEELQDDES